MTKARGVDNLRTLRQQAQEIEALHRTIQALKDEATAIAMGTVRQTPFAGATIALSHRQDLLAPYERLTAWLQKQGYPRSDILWLAIPIVLQLDSKDFFWITNSIAGQWYLESARSVEKWIVSQGLATPKASKGRDSHCFLPTPKLLHILNGETKLQLVK